MEPRHGDEHPHTPGPSIWPVGFAVGIACVLAGLVVSRPAVDRWRRHRRRLRRALGARRDAGPPRRRGERRASRRSAGRRAPPPPTWTTRPRQTVRSSATRGTSSSSCRRSRSAASSRRSSRSRRRLRRAARVQGSRVREVDLGPVRQLPRGRMDRGDVLPRSRRRRGLAADGVRPFQRNGRRAPELHAHLEPLRSPRLSRAGERAEERGPAQGGRGRQRRGEPDARSCPRTTAALATAAPTTPRGTAPPGRPSARSTGSSSTSSTATSSWSSATASPRSKVRAQRDDLRLRDPGPGRARRRPLRVDVSAPAAGSALMTVTPNQTPRRSRRRAARSGA